MPAAHEFIIGLGGVGGQCIAAFRRNCKIHADDYAYIKNKGAKEFQYLYIDSSDDISKLDKPWRVYGKSVKLNQSDIILMNDMEGKSVTSVSSAKNIKPWVGDISLAYNNMQSEGAGELFGLKGAGQLRRYGRVMFADHASTIYATLLQKVNELVQGSASDVNFRIFCTLGGGTGSGGVIDMITMIRELERGLSNTKFKIFVYPFVGGVFAGDDSNTGSFFENEYAALRDLNALALGHRYCPHIVAGVNAGKRFDLDGFTHPITNICLSSEVAEGTPSLDEQIEFIVKACFDTILYEYSANKPQCLKCITNEDLETHKGEGSDIEDGTPNPILRSYKFSTIASKRWCVPTTQIAEYLRLKREKAMFESLLNGAPLPKPNMPRQLDLELSFRLETSDTLELLEKKRSSLLEQLDKEKEEAIKSGKFGKDELAEIRGISDAAVKKAKLLEKDQPLALELDAAIKKDIENLMSDFVEKVEMQLDWISVTNAWGVEDILNYLNRYKTGTVDAWKTSHCVTRTVEEKENLEKGCLNKMAEREKEWEKLGVLTKLALSGMKVIPMLKAQHQDGTTRVACAFDSFRAGVIDRMAKEAKQALTAYAAKVDRAKTDIGSRMQVLDKDALGVYNDLRAKSGAANLTDRYEFNVRDLDAVVKYIEENMTGEHREQMVDIFCPIWQKCVPTLREYTEKQVDLTISPLAGKLYEAAAELEATAADNLGISDLLVANILDKLRKMAGQSDDESVWQQNLGPQIATFASSFRLSASMPPTARGRRAGANGDGIASPAKALLFGFPKSANQDAFFNWLKQSLINSLPVAYRPSAAKIDVFEHSSDDEIRLMYVPYWLPARFANITNIVYKKYAATLQLKEKGAPTLYFANIDDDEKLDPFTKPCVSAEGDPNLAHLQKLELGKLLYVNISKPNGEVVHRPIVIEDEKGYAVLKSDKLLPDYQTYDKESKAHPGREDEKLLVKAYTMALNSMTKEEKQEILMAKEQKVMEVFEQTQDALSPEYKALKAEADELKKTLGL